VGSSGRSAGEAGPEGAGPEGAESRRPWCCGPRTSELLCAWLPRPPGSGCGCCLDCRWRWQPCSAGWCAGDVTAQVALQPALRFNGGGHINHTIFWTNLSPNGGGEPKGELMEAIKRDFGSFEKFKEKLTAVSVGVQGSGWGWLGFNKEQGRLKIASCSNQDPLQGTTGLIPLLGIDVWEHAYYLQYKNVRPDYLKAIWNVINWENVSERYSACKK
uniref:Superoxide dismutase n=1 Tax=Sarcophilus harrisii TaxID=9305 RepID=A0A7N4PQ60_SARHA